MCIRDSVTCALYVQVESVSENGVRTFPIRLKLEPQTPVESPMTLKKLRNAMLYDENGKYRPGGFGFQKPSRLGIGRTMTVAEYKMCIRDRNHTKATPRAMAPVFDFFIGGSPPFPPESSWHSPAWAG